ncbi:hypothetical protein Tco_0658459 [Tanacetum coccineum]
MNFFWPTKSVWDGDVNSCGRYLDDGIVSRLKFVRIGEEVQQYGIFIPATMLNNDIIQLESYKMFILYSTGQIPPKKSRGKGSKGKKTANTTEDTIDESEDSDPEPLIRIKLSSRRVIKKKSTILAADNIVPEPDIALELGKSISLTEAEEEAVAREVHATYARFMSESVPKPARRRQIGIAFIDTFTVSKKRTSDPAKKLKGIQTLTHAEQEAADMMKALKESKITSRRQAGTGGLSEGTGRIPGVLDESIVVFNTSSEGTGTKPVVPDEEKLILEWGADEESEPSAKDVDAEDDNKETESDYDDLYKYKIKVRKDADGEMKDNETGEQEFKENEELSNEAKTNAVHDDDQPQDSSAPKTDKAERQTWYKQPQPQGLLLGPEMEHCEAGWGGVLRCLSGWSMATPIDFSKFVLNGHKIGSLTQDILLGPAFILLKGTCSSSIKLEFNFQECFNALTDKLDWNNPEGDHHPFDLSKPLPFQGESPNLTVADDYFFNNDLGPVWLVDGFRIRI